MTGIHTGVEGLDRTIHKTNVWLKELDAELGFGDRHRTYAALRESLHALRDHLTVEEAAQLGAQLPTLIRGIYYESWQPHGKPVKERSKEKFLAPLARALGSGSSHETERIARGVFRFIASWVSAGEMADVCAVLPHEIRELLPQ